MTNKFKRKVVNFIFASPPFSSVIRQPISRLFGLQRPRHSWSGRRLLVTRTSASLLPVGAVQRPPDPGQAAAPPHGRTGSSSGRHLLLLPPSCLKILYQQPTRPGLFGKTKIFLPWTAAEVQTFFFPAIDDSNRVNAPKKARKSSSECGYC